MSRSNRMAKDGSSSDGPQGGNRKKRTLPAETQDTDEEVQMESMLSEEANREVRDKYWELMTVVQHKEEEKNMEAQDIQMLLLQANDVFERVKHPREAAIDSQLLKMCGNLTKISIESTQSSLPVFRPREFHEKLISFVMDNEDEESDDDESEECPNMLVKLGRMTQSLSKTVKGVEPLLSAMEWERPVPQAKSKMKSEEQKEAKQKKVEVSMGDDEGETKAVAWKLKILKQCYAANRNEPICFYSFIVNPESFSSTIENLFHLSLLIREMHVEVLEDEDGLPVIQPTQTTNTAGEENQEKQCILSMDMDEWKEIIKTFEITSAMIPPLRKASRKRK